MQALVLSGDLTAELAQALRQGSRVAVDTETSGLDWRRDKLNLCQLFSPATGPIIVRRSDSRPVQLMSVLADSRVTKVLHYAPFDLRFLESAWRAKTSPVFCTKAASKLLNPQAPASEHSLLTQLANHLGVVLDKGAVRVSDWDAPSLTPEQLAYAAADVTALLDLADVLGSLLRERGLEKVHTAVCEYMPIDAWLKVQGIPDPLEY